jgi:hypothetical protein
MRLTVQQARDIVSALNAAADAAQKAGESDFDLVEVLSGLDDAARAQLQAAINAA